MASEAELKLKAKAKLKLQEQPPSWGTVLGQGMLKGGAIAADALVNTPENLYKLGQMAYGAGAVVGGDPSLAPSVEPPNNAVQGFLEEQGYLQPELSNMTPGQEVAYVAAQGAGSAALGGLSGGIRQSALNLGTAALGSGVGEEVAQETGSDVAGFVASVLTPSLASLSGSSKRLITQVNNAVRDKTLADAQALGYTVVPVGQVAEFANREHMLKIAIERNQLTTNTIARNALGGLDNKPLNEQTLNWYRKQQYNTGYVPVKNLGSFVTTPEYFDAFTQFDKKYKSGSFPEEVPAEIDKLINTYLVGQADSASMLDSIKILRDKSSRNIKSNDDLKVDVGFAQKEIANIMEQELERQMSAQGVAPEILERYKAARKNIAVSHTIEETLNKGTGDVDISSLARNYQRGDYMQGELEVAASFGNFIKSKPPEYSSTPSKEYPFTFGHAAGLAAGYEAARQLGLESTYGAYLAVLGAGSYHALKGMAGYLPRKYMTSKYHKVKPDYSNMGINPKMMAPAGLGFFNSIDTEEQ